MTLHFTGWEHGVKEGRSGLPHVSEQGIQWEKITLFALRSRFCLRSSKTVHGLRSCLTSKLHRLLFKSPKALSLCFFTNQISHYISLSLNKLVSVVEKKRGYFLLLVLLLSFSSSLQVDWWTAMTILSTFAPQGQTVSAATTQKNESEKETWEG